MYTQLRPVMVSSAPTHYSWVAGGVLAQEVPLQHHLELSLALDNGGWLCFLYISEGQGHPGSFQPLRVPVPSPPRHSATIQKEYA